MHRITKAAVLALIIVPALAESPLAQQPRQTAIYSSDSLDLQSPALSPNGKWVVFGAGRQERDNRQLMIIPAVGGAPRALTNDKFIDLHPVWSPAGDRIVFRSSRVADGLMTLRIDAANGTAVGAPQRLTIEPVQRPAFAFSPDGREVAYATAPTKGPAQIKVVPAVGGTARVLVDSTQVVMQLYWPALDTILYAASAPRLEPGRFAIMRVSPRGGTPVAVRSFDETRGFAMLAPGYVLRGARVRMNGDTVGTVSVVNARGDTVTRFDTHGSMNFGLNARLRPSLDGRTIMLAARISREEARVLSVDGGEPRPMKFSKDGPNSNSAYPYGFTADSRNVYLHSSRAGQRMMVMPIAGGDPKVIPLPADAFWPIPVPSGRYIYSWGGHPSDTSRSVTFVDVATGRHELISATATEATPSNGAGDELLYGEYRGGELEIRRWAPGKGSTVLHRVTPGRYLERFMDGMAVGPNGSAYAIATFQGDTTRILVGEGSRSRPVIAARGRPRTFRWNSQGRMLAAVIREPVGADSVAVLYVTSFDAQMRQVGPARAVARTAAGGNFTWPSWSPDGRTLALAVEHVRSPDTRVGVLLISANPEAGEVSAPNRVDIPRPATEWNDISWTKDGRHVLLLTHSHTTNRAQVWRIPRDGSSRLVDIAAREPHTFWEVFVSPDGKWLAYQADLPDRSTIWRVDLPSGR